MGDRKNSKGLSKKYGQDRATNDAETNANLSKRLSEEADGVDKGKLLNCLYWFRVLCCPPCVCFSPSVMTTRLAFFPPKPSYKMVPLAHLSKDSEFKKKKRKRQSRFDLNYALQLKQSSKWPFGPAELDKIEAVFVETKRKQSIACLHFKCVDEPKYTILFSHTNAMDLGMSAALLLQLGVFLNCNVCSYDYSGYGESSGRPSEKNIRADIEAVFQMLSVRYGVQPGKIILYGQSVGTAPTCYLAARKKVAGVIIESGFMSGMRVFCPNKRACGCCRPGRCGDHCCDSLVNIGECPDIESVVLVIHGEADEVVHVKHGFYIQSECPNTVEPLFLEMGRHNDIHSFVAYWYRLKKFVDVELPKRNITESLPPPKNFLQNNSNVLQSTEIKSSPATDIEA